MASATTADAVSAAADESVAALRARHAAVRSRLAAGGLAAFVVPTSDAHNSEYVAEADARRAYISGFDGSAGTAVVLAAEHGPSRLWTDGRYFLQAAAQLDAGEWALMRDRLPGTPSVEAWLSSAAPEGAGLPRGAAVGVDPRTVTAAFARRLRAALERAGLALVEAAPGGNPVDAAWEADARSPRPPAPRAPLRVHPLELAGAAPAAKLAAARAAMAAEGAGALLVSALDEVAWLLNVRGGDVPCCPVAHAYVLVTAAAAGGGAPDADAAGAGAGGGAGGGATLFVDGAKVTPAVAAHLADAGVAVAPYAAVEGALEAAAAGGARVWLDPASASAAAAAAVARGAAAAAPGGGGGGGEAAGGKRSPLALPKAVKNAAELAGMRAAHARDAAALVTFLAWVSRAARDGYDERTRAPLAFALDEATAAGVLDGMRAAAAGFVSPSFESIVGYAANGAVIHYRPRADGSALPLLPTGLLLVDSGGQFVDGTTDVTRTLLLGPGPAAPAERAAYAAVLRGHIALARARFPAGALGNAMDAIARAPVWAAGLDYRHGTGHGVGAALNVHEGPVGFSATQRPADEPGVVAGWVMSDEPGVYVDGAFGVRIESLLAAVPAADGAAFNGVPWLEWEVLTLVPIPLTGLVGRGDLRDDERAWLNDYHKRCREVVAPLLKDGYALEWLLVNTYPL